MSILDAISDFMRGSRKRAKRKRARRDGSREVERCLQRLVEAGYSPKFAARKCGQILGLSGSRMGLGEPPKLSRKKVTKSRKKVTKRAVRSYMDTSRSRAAGRSRYVKVCEKVYFAKWIQKAVPKSHRGKLRKLLGIRKGETIPASWKEQGCKNPRKTFYKLLGRIPTAKEARHFQQMMCFAKTAGKISKKRKHARKAA